MDARKSSAMFVRALIRAWAGIGIVLLAGMPLVRAETVHAPARTVQLDIALAPPGRLPWVSFDERSGLPQHTIVDLVTDERGFVWAATQDGAARFNGQDWDTLTLPPEMHSNYPRVMRAARGGGLWIGTFDGGLARWTGRGWEVFAQNAALPSRRIRGLLETGEGDTPDLWIATDRGVARSRQGQLQVFGLDEGLPNLDCEAMIESDRLGGPRQLLVGTAAGLARFDGARFVSVPVPESLHGHRIDDIIEAPGLSGGPALWLASYGGGIAIYEAGAWTMLDTASGLPSNVEVFAASQADDGSPALWIGSEGGLLRFEHGRFTRYDERSGLPIRIIWKVMETVSPGGLRTLWLGTWGGGVVRLSPNVWRTFDAASGLPSGAVTSVLLTRDAAGADVIWAGTSDGELAKWSGDRFVPVPLPQPLRHTILFSLLETRNAAGAPVLWVASFGGGIGRLEDGRWTLLDTRGLPNRRVYQLVESQADDGATVLWAATEGGLAKLEQGVWKTFREGLELPSTIVTQVLETTADDGSRTLWVATSKGVARLHRGAWDTFDRNDGLASDNILSLQLATDAGGVRWLWAGTLSGGALRFRVDDPNAPPEVFSTRGTPALPSDTVQSIAADQSGRIYLCTTRGVARLTPRTPDVLDGSRFGLELISLEDGLPSSDCQQGARLVDADGRIWFGTARGLAMYDPRLERPDDRAKPLWIDRVELSDGRLQLRGDDVLDHSQRNLSFSASLLAHRAESRIRYRFQLEGFDPQPGAWQEARRKDYTNLGAGQYRFVAWARDAGGFVSGPVGFAFTIRPAPWLSWWAYAGYALLLALLARVLVHWRVRVLAERNRVLENEVALRTQDLVAARDELSRIASEDVLTGVANRRQFGIALQQSWRAAQDGARAITLVLIDVDHFKRYNDHYGHGAGDVCLRRVAQAIAGACPAGGLVARYGGEEFVLIIPDADAVPVGRMLQAMLAAVEALAIAHSASVNAAHVTVSIGAVTVLPTAEDHAESALQQADALLYEAKAQGRGRALYRHRDDEVRVLLP